MDLLLSEWSLKEGGLAGCGKKSNFTPYGTKILYPTCRSVISLLTLPTFWHGLQRLIYFPFLYEYETMYGRHVDHGRSIGLVRTPKSSDYHVIISRDRKNSVTNNVILIIGKIHILSRKMPPRKSTSELIAVPKNEMLIVVSF